jgi:hypothetical protein
LRLSFGNLRRILISQMPEMNFLFFFFRVRFQDLFLLGGPVNHEYSRPLVCVSKVHFMARSTENDSRQIDIVADDDDEGKATS